MAFHFAHEAPQALDAVALISPAGARWSPERLETTLKSFDINTIQEARGFVRKLFAKPSLPVLAFAGEFRAMMSDPILRSIRKEVTLEDEVTESMLGGMNLPPLLIWGQQEKLLPYESVDYCRAHFPKSAEVHEVRSFGHMPQVEHPREFVRRVLSFAENRGLI